MFRLPKLQVNSLAVRPSSRTVMTSHLMSLRGNLRKQDLQEDTLQVSAFGPFLRPPSSTSFLYSHKSDVGKNKSALESNVELKSDDVFGIKCGNKFHPLLLTPHNKLSLLADILLDEKHSSPNLTLTTDLKPVRRKVAYHGMIENKSQLKLEKPKDTKIKPLDLEKILSKNKQVKKLNSIDDEYIWSKFVEHSRVLKHIKSKSATNLLPKTLKSNENIEDQKVEKFKPKMLNANDFKPFNLTLNKNNPIERLLITPKRDPGTLIDQTIFQPSKQSLKKVLKIPQQNVNSLKEFSNKEIPVLPSSSKFQKKIVIPTLPKMPKKVSFMTPKSPAVPFSSTGTAKQIQRKSSKKVVQNFELKLPRIVRSHESIDKNGIFSLKSILRAQQSNVNLKR